MHNTDDENNLQSTTLIFFFFSHADKKVTYRGCIPKDEKAPFDDGWETKNKCKTVSGVRTCTCKGDDMCNSANVFSGSVAVWAVVGVVTAVRTVVALMSK